MEARKVDFIEMNIIDDGKQLSVRFPKKVVEALDINPSKDIFVFEIDKETLQLRASLEDKEVWDREYHGRKTSN